MKTEENILDVAHALAFLAGATGKPMQTCKAVVDAWISLIKNDIQERSNSSPRTVYAAIQQGDYKISLLDDLRIENYLPGDFWIPMCRESKTDYAIVSQIMKAFAQFFASNGEKHFAPLGKFHFKPEEQEHQYSITLRPDLIGPPSPESLLEADKEEEELLGEG